MYIVQYTEDEESKTIEIDNITELRIFMEKNKWTKVRQTFDGDAS